jgi:malate synthase
LLRARAERQERISAGELPDFLESTRSVREGDWRVAPVPHDLQDRRVEITGPAGDRKMVINAFNSGARIYMADFEDANSPTWANVVGGQQNLTDAIERTISIETPDKRYALNDDVAVLLVRPRGWHLPSETSRSTAVRSRRASSTSASTHATERASRAARPVLLPPEAREPSRGASERRFLAQDASVCRAAPSRRRSDRDDPRRSRWRRSCRAREHSGGLNAGRWDYIFSVIKKFHIARLRAPDRAQVTMTVPFMRAYTELLVRTCHSRGAHAIGGMAAFIPSRRDPEVNEIALARVREDKQRESGDGFDGTWVAHPDLVSTAMVEFDAALGERPNQLERLREDVSVEAADLLDVAATPGEVTDAGVRANVSVGIRYIAAWLSGVGRPRSTTSWRTPRLPRSPGQVWRWVLRPGRTRGRQRTIGRSPPSFPSRSTGRARR